MINPGGNPFENAEKQQNDTINKGWSTFADTNAEISKQDKEEYDKDEIVSEAVKLTKLAKDAYKGKDSIDTP